MAIGHRIAVRGERLVYRIAALPTAVRRRDGRDTPSLLRSAVRQVYWHPTDWTEWLELAAALLLWPLAVPIAIIWFTAKNGPIVQRRHRKSIVAQLGEQLRLYFSAGILAPWYYIFELWDDGFRRAPTFLQRSETKWGVYLRLRVRKASPLSDKSKFAERCAEHGIRCVPNLLLLDGRHDRIELPARDLFVKLANGRGGKGAEGWDFDGQGRYLNREVGELDRDALRKRLLDRASRQPLLVQPRLSPHPELIEITSGALPTVRALTCLNEQGDPELAAAVFRMSVGENRTVDNIHAGGIACGVSLSGALGRASNLGVDARLGWLTDHPDTGAPIEGRTLPFWSETRDLAIQAHRAFADRAMIGWDIAILEDGPIVIEGNGSPDVDLMQRFMRTGFCQHRYGELLVWHLRKRGSLS
jgi:hypothetical protein